MIINYTYSQHVCSYGMERSWRFLEICNYACTSTVTVPLQFFVSLVISLFSVKSHQINTFIFQTSPYKNIFVVHNWVFITAIDALVRSRVLVAKAPRLSCLDDLRMVHSSDADLGSDLHVDVSPEASFEKKWNSLKFFSKSATQSILRAL